MNDYMTEQEQIEQLKGWIKQYGPTILLGVVLAMVLVTGWQYWQSRQNNKLYHASGIYDQMLDARSQPGKSTLEKTATPADRLMSNYPKTPYAPLAALMLARNAVAKQDFPAAIKQLHWVIDHSKNHSLQQIARVRIARIQIAQQQPAAAIESLNTVSDSGFAGLIAEIKGDAYMKLHDLAKAKAEYQVALQALPSDEVTERPLIQMKLDNIATA